MDYSHVIWTQQVRKQCSMWQKMSLNLFQTLACICFLRKVWEAYRVLYIPKRYSKYNNEYLKYYDPEIESKHIIYLAANNLYGYAIVISSNKQIQMGRS